MQAEGSTEEEVCASTGKRCHTMSFAFPRDFGQTWICGAKSSGVKGTDSQTGLLFCSDTAETQGL